MIPQSRAMNRRHFDSCQVREHDDLPWLREHGKVYAAVEAA